MVTQTERCFQLKILLHCDVIIELKNDEFRHEDLGQLNAYDNQLFVSAYMLHLPDKKKLEEFMLKEIEEMGM